jgi:predicted nucleotidyltransferase
VAMAIEASAGKLGLAQTVVDRINSVFALFPSIEKVILYGSRAKGNYHPGSDIDLAIVGPDVTEEQILKLEDLLDDLLLPYTIDLCRFESIRNHDLIQHINRVGIPFYTSA